MAKQRKNRLPEKPLLLITGKEKSAFDFFSSIRKAYREQHNYVASEVVIKELTHSPYWENVDWVLKTLEKYFNFFIEKR